MEKKEKHVRFNLFEQLKRLEVQRGRNYPAREVARGANLHLNTVLDVLHNHTRQVRFDTLEALLDFLRREGLAVELDDLLVEAEGERGGRAPRGKKEDDSGTA